MPRYRRKVRTEEDLENLVADIMINEGPDGHCDGCDIIASEIWKRVLVWRKH